MYLSGGLSQTVKPADWSREPTQLCKHSSRLETPFITRRNAANAHLFTCTSLTTQTQPEKLELVSQNLLMCTRQDRSLQFLEEVFSGLYQHLVLPFLLSPIACSLISVYSGRNSEHSSVAKRRLS